MKNLFQADPNAKITKFLALDKCLPRRDFLQVCYIEDLT